MRIKEIFLTKLENIDYRKQSKRYALIDLYDRHNRQIDKIQDTYRLEKRGFITKKQRNARVKILQQLCYETGTAIEKF